MDDELLVEYPVGRLDFKEGFSLFHVAVPWEDSFMETVSHFVRAMFEL